MSRCLVLGATGYVGRGLVTALTRAGHEVTAASRRPPAGSTPNGQPRYRSVDATDPVQLRQALTDIDVVYFLMHSLELNDFTAVDRGAATLLAQTSAEAGVGQIVYLGGTRPAPAAAPVSAHLASRAEVGDILLAGPVPAFVLQASMIIGTGSASFTLLRAAAEASPLLPAPGWMASRSNPVAEADLVHYLEAAAEMPNPVNDIVEVSGPETLTYLQLVQRTARVLGLPARFPVPAPLWSHRLAAGVAGLFTPISRGVAESLFESLRHDLLPRARDVTEVLRDHAIAPTPVDTAIRRACGIRQRTAPTGPCFTDEHVVSSHAQPDELWRKILDIGGDSGWHTLPLVWALRGAVDHLAGGVGLYRGRAPDLSKGDVVDFWTVHDRDDEARCLTLSADMRMPGRTLLTMSVIDTGEGCEYVQRITYFPGGDLGSLYWHVQKPAHDVVFTAMAHRIAGTASSDMGMGIGELLTTVRGALAGFPIRPGGRDQQE